MKKIFLLILCLLAPRYLLSEGLAAQTLVATRTGYKKIENLACDDLIVCYDRLRHNLTEEKVTWLHITKVSSYIQMVAGNDLIEMACDQRLYVPSQKRWVIVADVVHDLNLLEAVKNDYGIETIREVGEEKCLYTLTVNPHHNFFITEHHILVHNRKSARGGVQPHKSPRLPTTHTTKSSPPHDKKPSIKDHPKGKSESLPKHSEKPNPTQGTKSSAPKGGDSGKKPGSKKTKKPQEKTIRNGYKKKAQAKRNADRGLDANIPRDAETILKNSGFRRTNFFYQKAQIYVKDGIYYYRDQEHKTSPHLEAFNKQGIHLGEVDTKTGEIKPGTADPGKNFKNNLSIKKIPWS